MSGDSAAPPFPEADFFWIGLEHDRLLLPHCAHCAESFFPPAPGCPRCGRPDRIEVREASAVGQVYSWIVAHYAFEPEFAAEIPYAVVEVRLAEGPRVYTRFDGDLDALAADLEVRVLTRRRDGRPYLVCRPAGGTR